MCSSDLLQSVFDSLFMLLGDRAEEKNLALTNEIPPALSALELRGDALRLGQIFINLIGNAIKFTEAGRITLRGRTLEEERGDQWLAGIHPRDRAVCREAFGQAAREAQARMLEQLRRQG